MTFIPLNISRKKNEFHLPAVSLRLLSVHFKELRNTLLSAVE